MHFAGLDDLSGLKVVLFDLDGTIRRVRPTDHQTLLEQAQALGYQFDWDAQRQAILWSHAYWANWEQSNRDARGLDRLAFWQNFAWYYFAAMGVDAALLDEIALEVGRNMAEHFRPEGYLMPGVKELLWRLRSEKYILGMVSNRHNPLTGTAIELGVIEHFHFTLAAGQINRWKPDPALFRLALMLAGGVAPQEAMYIGDNYYADVIGAREAGIIPVLMDEFGIYYHLTDECLVIEQFSQIDQLIPANRVE